MAESATNVEVTKKSTPPARLRLVPSTDLLSRMQQLSDSIARRAFEIFEGHGGIFGRDLDNWLQAESEVLHPVHIEVTESDGELNVQAEVPGFTEKELEISVEGRRLSIAGKRETKEERKEKQTIYTERCSNRIFRVIDLPTEVDATKASATLKNGMLEIKAPKAAPAKKIPIEARTA